MPFDYVKPDKWIFMNENEIGYLFKDFIIKLNEELSQKFIFTKLVNYAFLKNEGKLYLLLSIETSSNYFLIRDYLQSIFNFNFVNEYYNPKDFKYELQFRVK